jgi:hypothetical protein
MKQKRVLILLMLLAVISLLLNTASIFRSAKEKDAAESGYNGLVAEYSGGEVCEVVVDLGYVKRSAVATETIRLVNRSNSPILLLDYSTQCRCMWLEFEREPIAPNESVDILLTFDSRGEWGSVGNYMEITTSVDNTPIVLWIGAEIE